MWMDPTKVKNLTSPQSGQIQLGFKTRQVHKVDGPSESKLLDKVDGPYEGSSLGKSTKWTDPTRIQYLTGPQSGWTHLGLKSRQVHKVDGPYED